MNNLVWLDKHKLKGVSKKELQYAGSRYYKHFGDCECGEKLTTIICDECSRLYKQRLFGIKVDGNTVVETVNVVFNGGVTLKTFIWEL